MRCLDSAKFIGFCYSHRSRISFFIFFGAPTGETPFGKKKDTVGPQHVVQVSQSNYTGQRMRVGGDIRESLLPSTIR